MPQVANLLIEMIGGGGLGRTDQKVLNARVDHDPRFFVRVKAQRFQTLNQLRGRHLFVEVDRVQRCVLAGRVGGARSGRMPDASACYPFATPPNFGVAAHTNNLDRMGITCILGRELS